MSLPASSSNRNNNRYSALRSLVQENDTEIEDELARGTSSSSYLILLSSAALLSRLDIQPNPSDEVSVFFVCCRDLHPAQKKLRELKARISAQSKKNFVLERDVRYLDSRIALLIQNVSRRKSYTFPLLPSLSLHCLITACISLLDLCCLRY